MKRQARQAWRASGGQDRTIPYPQAAVLYPCARGAAYDGQPLSEAQCGGSLRMVILRGWQPSKPIPRSWRQPGSLRNYLAAIASMGSSRGAPGSPSLPCRVGPLRCTDPSAVLPRVDRVVYLVLAFLINLPVFSSRGGSRGMFISRVRLNEYRMFRHVLIENMSSHSIWILDLGPYTLVYKFSTMRCTWLAFESPFPHPSVGSARTT